MDRGSNTGIRIRSCVWAVPHPMSLTRGKRTKEVPTKLLSAFPPQGWQIQGRHGWNCLVYIKLREASKIGFFICSEKKNRTTVLCKLILIFEKKKDSTDV
jgi:hypothetical protein